MMSKKKALKKLERALRLVSKLDGILGEIHCEVDEAGLDVSSAIDDDVCGPVYDVIYALQGLAEQL